MHLIGGGCPAFDWLINHCLGVVDWPLSRVGSVSTKLFCARRLRSGNPRCFLPPLPDWPSYWLRIGAQPSARVCDWSTAVSRPVIGGNTAMCGLPVQYKLLLKRTAGHQAEWINSSKSCKSQQKRRYTACGRHRRQGRWSHQS